MGDHYTGHYDEVHSISVMLAALNKRHNWQIGIHVDAASGGFVAPFQPLTEPWDFRNESIMTISASGHKYGQAMCGIGWIIFRCYTELAEHVATRTTYLGGEDHSYTLNFSRPATSLYVQFYKFQRLGELGYARLAQNMCNIAQYISTRLTDFKVNGIPRFRVLSQSAVWRLPVVSVLFNPEWTAKYNAIVLQNKILERGWFVSGYNTAMYHPVGHELVAIFADLPPSSSMFRIVVKSNMSMMMAQHLLQAIEQALEWLDAHFCAASAPVELARGLC